MTRHQSAQIPGTITAQSLFERAFHATRTPRSPAYKAGVLAALRFRLGEASDIPAVYSPGTAEYDAYHAGIDEGHAIARNALGGAA